MLVSMRAWLLRYIGNFACIKWWFVLAQLLLLLDTWIVMEWFNWSIMVLNVIDLSISVVIDSHESAFTSVYDILHSSELNLYFLLDFVHILIELFNFSISFGDLINLFLDNSFHLFTWLIAFSVRLRHLRHYVKCSQLSSSYLNDNFVKRLNELFGYN